MATVLKLSDLEFGFIAPIGSMSLTVEITRLNCGQVEVLSCTFGKLSAVTIKLKINTGFKLI